MLWQGLGTQKASLILWASMVYALATHHRLEDLLDTLIVNFHWIWRQHPLKEEIVKKIP